MYAYAHIGTKYYLQMQVDMPKEQLAYNVPLELAQEAASSYIAWTFSPRQKRTELYSVL